MEKKSFTRQSVCFCVLFSLMCTGLLRGYVRDVPADPNSQPLIMSAGVLPASLNDPNANYLVYKAGDESITNAMQYIGVNNVRVRDNSTAVTAQDWDWCDIVVIGANGGSANITGIDTDDIESRITGRVILSGHDADLHTNPGYPEDAQWASKLFLIQSINYVMDGAGKGLIGLGDSSAAFEWSPQSWGLVCTKGFMEEEVVSFTEEGLAAGVYEYLTPGLMSNWDVSFHVRFDGYGQGFFPYETGYFEDEEGTVTIGCPINPYGVVFEKWDDVNELECRSPGQEITYTIYWENTSGLTLDDVAIVDRLPAGVDYDYLLSLNPPSLDPNFNNDERSYRWEIGTVEPNASGSVNLTVTVNEKATSGYFLTNTAELWVGGSLADRAVVHTPVCCWDDGTVIYVDWSATGAESGMNWQDAYTDLQDALTRARESICTGPFTIYVAQGPYSPGEHADDSFELPEGVSVYGGFPNGGCAFSQRNPKRYETILTGLIDATHRNDTVVTMGDETLLDGVTVTDAAFLGHGVYGYEVDFTIENCVVEENWQYGIRAIDGDVAVKWCTVRSNLLDGIRHEGEGFILTIENSWIMKNSRYGIYCQNSTPYILNSIVSESDLNEAGNEGVRLINPASPPVLYNNTFAHNRGAGIFFVGNGDPNNPILPDVQNCILWYNNAGGEQFAGFSKECVYHSCIYDPNDPNGVNLTQDVHYNISANPLFAYYDPNNVHITYGSPCKDAGNPDYTNDDVGLYDMDCSDRIINGRVDIGAYEIDCEDAANLYDWNADGLVNLYEFNFFSRAWLAHDPNDPAWTDPNLADPNLSEGWYEWKHKCNLVTAGTSAYQVDLADLVVWVEESPWLWRACWLTDGLLSEQSTAMMLAGVETLSLETEAIEEKSAIKQAVYLANIIVQLEQLWREEPDIHQEIDADDWNRFMESVYNSLSELEIDAVGTK